MLMRPSAVKTAARSQRIWTTTRHLRTRHSIFMSAEKKSDKPAKQRLDHILVDRGLVESRSLAQSLIMAGKVYIGTDRMTKAGQLIGPDVQVEIQGKEHPWVSRGGMKLEHALKEFNLDPTGATAVDIGASTGGFCDVLLSYNAKKIYAVDVGYGQLAWKIRQDERVVVIERTNARYLTREQVSDPVDYIVCDASFIGLETVLPASLELANPNGCTLVALIKPQFEVGRGRVGKGGVVRDSALHKEVCDRISEWLTVKRGWFVRGIVPSPITGPEGNREFLICASNRDPSERTIDDSLATHSAIHDQQPSS